MDGTRSRALYATVVGVAAASLAFAIETAGDDAGAVKPAAQEAARGPFSALERPAAQEDRETNALGAPGTAASRTQRKLRVAGRKQAWAAIEGDQTCVGATSDVEASVASACVDSAIAANDGVWSVSRPAPDDVSAGGLSPAFAEITALLPDGVREATVVLADGRAVTEPVVDNALLISVTSSPESATWTDGNGVRKTLALSAQAAS